MEEGRSPLPGSTQAPDAPTSNSVSAHICKSNDKQDIDSVMNKPFVSAGAILSRMAQRQSKYWDAEFSRPKGPGQRDINSKHAGRGDLNDEGSGKTNKNTNYHELDRSSTSNNIAFSEDDEDKEPDEVDGEDSDDEDCEDIDVTAQVPSSDLDSEGCFDWMVTTEDIISSKLFQFVLPEHRILVRIQTGVG